MIEAGTEYPVSAAREHFADLVNAAAFRHEATYVTRHGKRIAVIVPVEDYEEMREQSRTPKRGTGAALKAMMARHLEQFGPGDDSWARDLEDLRRTVGDAESVWDED
jgi:prevent-host-death family protein